MTDAEEHMDAAEMLILGGGATPIFDVEVLSFQSIHQPGGAEACCFTFETTGKRGIAIGRLWLSEPMATASKRIMGALRAGGTLTVWGQRTIERHPEGQFWINGHVEVMGRSK